MPTNVIEHGAEVKREDLYVSPSLKKEIEKEGIDYCGSTDLEVFKNQYISECSDDGWIALLQEYMVKDGLIKKICYRDSVYGTPKVKIIWLKPKVYIDPKYLE